MIIPSFFPVTCHTKHIGPGSIFVAIKGFKSDGANYIPQAIECGATTIVVDKTRKQLNIPSHIEVITVDDTRQALAIHAAKALGYPAKKLNCIGITGTAGKTTTTYLIEHILAKAGFKTALLGSIKNKIGPLEEESSLTTPEADHIQMFLAECVKQGVEYVVMEVSSHSIALSRIYGIQFDAIGFTNLSPEHMDFHQTMDHYFQTKAKLFHQAKPNCAIVINTDNQWGQKASAYCIDHKLSSNIIAFGAKNQTIRPCPALIGSYNNYNISMASLICSSLGTPQETITKALVIFNGVPGRLQPYTLKNGARAFVDYAHKPGAFEEVLKALRPLSQHLIIVFGCGGDRDKTKRPVMGKLAADYADLIIITDDNPRFENPQTIANEIITGIPQEKLPNTIVELDRRKAIAIAAQKSHASSIIAILGKGHENYHLVKNEKQHLDDMEEIKRF